MALIQASIEQLRVGHYIHLPTGWTNHPFMFNTFKIKDQQQLDILRHLDLTLLMVDPDKSDLPIEPLLRGDIPDAEPDLDELEELIASGPPPFDEKAFRRSMRAADKAFGQSMSELRDALGALNLKPDEGLANTAQIVRNAAFTLSQHEGPLGLHLIRSPHTDILLQHSLNVAFIAMLMARELGMNPIEIEETGLAGLIHDIGELKIPSQITQKRGDLSKAEQNFLNMHPQYGLEMLTQLNAFEPKIRQVAHLHHERLDGSGYPLGIKGGEIPPLARLIGLVDFYDELLHPRNSGNPAAPSQAISQLYKLSQKKFDQNLVKLLVKVLGVYPPGSLVKLSDESIALVLSTEPTMPLKPKILPYIKAQRPEAVAMIDLREDERTITAFIKQEELDEGQRQFFNLTRRFCYYFAF
ncbi:HD-GYP domain-containing protein [Aeromonas veronii]|uniref:HD-GYP domain-containing protein n=1 Tax=Aeromonas veronii TaxID=654 RepID=UPI00111639E4|nr:HD-GYP domain-containing protein [Aeromonas veronii]TNI06154.1 phosphodiesterase [Aeromonas veronii]HDO1310010.1 HD-GYP domain-containing protein [Aeromonas veronii]HDO1314247.1 HD-GYP domain-containing protein [Aeromonas veronii]